MSGGSTSPASAEAAATNSRASLPGVGEGLAPGYPAAAARPFFSSPKVEETLTASCRSYGGLMALSGTARASGRDQPLAEARNDRRQHRRRCLRFGEIQLHAHAIRIVEEDLRISSTRHNALAEFHVLRLKALANTFDISRGEGDVVEASVSSYFFSVPRTTMPSRGLRVPIRCTVATPPVARKIERRTFAVLQSQHIAIEILGALQIGWLHREMLQSTTR